MEHPRNTGLGLRADSTSAPIKPEAVLSTAPASPTEDEPHMEPTDAPHSSHHSSTSTMATTKSSRPHKHATVAQLSFGPATQQTVTTVTTTTTVTLPPLIMKPPRNLYERDIKQYPLAYSPTPPSLKRFCTSVNGMPIRFQEEEDARESWRRHQELQAKIQRHKGAVRSEEQHPQDYRTPLREYQTTFEAKQMYDVRASHVLKRTATPPSIAEAAEIASLHRKSKKPRSQLQRTASELQEQPSLNQRAAAGEIPIHSNPTPVTPDTDVLPTATASRHSFGKNGGPRRRSPTRPSQSRLQELHWNEAEKVKEVLMMDSESPTDDSKLSSRFYGSKSKRKRSQVEEDAISVASHPRRATTTPPMVDAEFEDAPAVEEVRRPTLSHIVTSSQQDASLPSPSLSPITAAANLASRQNTFDVSFGRHLSDNNDAVSALDLDEEDLGKKPSFSSHTTGAIARPEVPPFQATESHQQQQPLHQQRSPTTIMDIPTMIEAFDGMPEVMQTYIIYQLLRRCAKPTLQVVANVVNPALKCDPFNVLPVELGLSIIRYLDVQSMCRAAQVSKRWRRHINSDEKAWKDLLDRDGFVLPEGEIARAVAEGWGWQHPGEEGYEEDLSQYAARESVAAASFSPPVTLVSDDEDSMTSSTILMKARRKMPTGSSKNPQRRTVQVSASATKPSSYISTSRINRLVGSASSGPHGLAHAATQAVPHPHIGLPSLQNMHLFKSLYQRHYLIRKAWMTKDSQPQHLAFRAHHRHVVTCLLFDSEKILTGSDDTKINIYDTQTGALKNRLEGHEGGVWALQYEGDFLVSGSTDRTVRVWDITTGRCLQVFQGHTSTVRCLVILKPEQIDTAADGTPIYMPKEPLIITGSRDSTLRVWKLPQPGDHQVFQTAPSVTDRDNPYFLRTLSGHSNSVRAIAARGDTLVSGSYDCTVRVWKISTGELVHRLQGHTQKVYSVVLDHARNRCISGSMDNSVKIWDLQSGACLFNLEGHSSLVGLLDLSHDRLISAAADSTLRIWDPESGACKATLSAHTGAITCFQHDGQKVISGSDRTLKMWNVRNGNCVKDLLTDLSGVWQVRFDERRCVAAVQRNNLTYIEVLDFGAFRDGVGDEDRGRRVVVDCRGREIEDVDASPPDPNVAELN